jgi:hypothetical protein
MIFSHHLHAHYKEMGRLLHAPMDKSPCLQWMNTFTRQVGRVKFWAFHIQEGAEDGHKFMKCDILIKPQAVG